MKNLDEILATLGKVGANSEVANEVEYIKIQELYKAKLNEDLPQGVWRAENDQPTGWASIEHRVWELINAKGFDTKLFLLWMQSYIGAYGYEAVAQIFKSIEYVFDQNKYFSLEGDEYKLSYINHMDKTLSSAILSLNLNLQSSAREVVSLYQFENYNLEHFSDFEARILEISDVNFQKLKTLYDDIANNCKSLKEKIESVCVYNLQKVEKTVEQLGSFLEYRAKVQENVDSQMVANEDQKVGQDRNIFFYRNEAFTRVEEAAEILERVDPQNMMIPLLRKALKWKDATLVTIFEDIGSPAEVQALINLLKNKSE